jgi:hypothetical protein
MDGLRYTRDSFRRVDTIERHLRAEESVKL